MRTRCDLLLVLGFGAALLAPALAWRLDPAAWRAVENENRQPATFPELDGTLRSLQAFPAGFEAWQADTLGLRTPLMRWNNALALGAFRTLPSPQLLLGRQGWIFFTGEQSREVWRGLYPLSRDFADNWIAALRSRAAWFARRGITYLYVVAPNKESVYPDRLPAGEEALGPTLLERLDEALREHPELPFLDLRAALADERAYDRPSLGDVLYHPLGTHWTERAGWRAAQEIAARLAELDPALQLCAPTLREDCRRAELFDGDDDSWAVSLQLAQCWRQRTHSFRPRAPQAEACSPGSEDLHAHECLFERRDGAGERLLLLHDSFGPWLRAPLAERCARLLALWDELPLERIAAEAPRVVVELRSERRMRNLPVWLADPLVALAEADWQALAPLAPLPPGPRSLDGVAPYEGSRVERAQDGLRIVSPEGNARVAFDGWAPGPGGKLVLHLRLRAPAATQATLWYQTRDEPRFHPRRRNVLQLEAGPNEFRLRLPEAGIEGPLLFQPGEVPGEYLLEGLEARSGQ